MPGVNLADLRKYRHLRGQLLLVFDNKFMLCWPDGGATPQLSTSTATTRTPSIRIVPHDRALVLREVLRWLGDLGRSQEQGQRELGAGGRGRACERGVQGAPEPFGPISHLLWIYWQQTGGDVRENTTDAKGMYNRLDKFLFDVTNSKLPKPNVIGHDFVDQDHVHQNRQTESGSEGYQFLT